MGPDDELAVRLGRELGGTVEGLRRLSGGASRLTYSLELRTADGARRRLICQLDRGGGAGSSTGVAVEAALLRAAGAAGVPAPVVVAVGELDQGSGRGLLVVERVDGETIPRRILRDARWAAARAALPAQCGAALAAIHRIDPASIPGLPPRDPLRDPLAVLDAVGEVRPVLELGTRWLARHAPPSTGRTTVHGDFRLGNLLVGEEGLRAVLDWELAHAGDPAEDVGWLCARSWRFGGPGRVGGFGALRELLDAYAASGGAALDENRVTWWEAYAAEKWAVICALQASAHLSGAVHSVELAAIGRRVCESEWDLLLLLGATPHVAPPSERTAVAASPLPRPTATELLEAVQGSLVSEGSDRERFEARVARNALGIVARELALGPALVAAHAQRLRALGFDGDGSLCAALRAGALDDDLEHVASVLAASAYEQLEICNPSYVSGR